MHVHSVDKYINSAMRQTSNAHGWSHLLAERWTHGSGELPRLVPACTEVVIQLQGRGLVDRVGGGRVERTRGGRGTIWICPEGVEEEYIHVAEPLDDCLHIFLPKEPLARFISEDLQCAPGQIQLRYQAISHDPFIEVMAAQVLRELDQESGAGPMLIEGLSMALTAHLVKNYSEYFAPTAASTSTVKPLEGRRLKRVADFIQDKIDSPLTVGQLAEIACMSPAHFTRSFRAATGQTPHAYVLAARLELARRKLSDPMIKIEDVAWSTGFSSQASFSKAFRQANGITPGQFRAQCAAPMAEARPALRLC